MTSRNWFIFSHYLLVFEAINFTHLDDYNDIKFVILGQQRLL